MEEIVLLPGILLALAISQNFGEPTVSVLVYARAEFAIKKPDNAHVPPETAELVAKARVIVTQGCVMLVLVFAIVLQLGMAKIVEESGRAVRPRLPLLVLRIE